MKLTDELVIDLEVAFNGTNQETSSENRSADEFNTPTKFNEKTSFHHSPYKKENQSQKSKKGSLCHLLKEAKSQKVKFSKIIVHICIE